MKLKAAYKCSICYSTPIKTRRDKCYPWSLRPGPTQTGLYNHRKWLDRGLKFRIEEVEGIYSISEVKKKALIKSGNHAVDLRLFFGVYKKQVI